jgi:acetyl esterase/lipase
MPGSDLLATCNLRLATISCNLDGMKLLLIVISVMTSGVLFAQQKIFLYPTDQKVTIDGFELDTEPPHFEVYPADPAKANGSAILVCPGGGYGHLAVDHEGKQVAEFFNANGFQAFVLHYRLNNGAQQGHKFPDQYNDVTLAMRIIRSRAAEWKVDPDRIGIIGFSAGGHLASMATTMHIDANRKGKSAIERVSSRPSFSILVYPVIDLAGQPAHRGSRINLLGVNPDNALVDSLSTQNRVNDHTPPTFIVFSTDDEVVPPENGVLFYQALRVHGVPASLHIYDHGGHGYGLAQKDPVLNTWPGLAVEWLRRLGY